jgi:hypothetical protein
MYINYCIDSTDNAKQYTVENIEDMSYSIESMFKAYGSRLVVTSIVLA